MTRHRRFGRTIARTGLSGLLAVALVLEGHALAASTGCGEYSFGFEGTRLLNDGISTSAGSFTIALPAGTYDVTMVSHDAHDEHPGQDDQTQEQFYFTLDSGYTSPPSNDIPNDVNDMTTIVGAQEIGDTTSITVHHLGQGGVNSVDVRCVGFTTVQVAGPDPEPEPEVVDPEPEPEPEVAAPAPVTPEVAAKVETPVAQLARTGPPEIVLAFAGLGLFLVGYGVVLMNLDVVPAFVAARSRRR